MMHVNNRALITGHCETTGLLPRRRLWPALAFAAAASFCAPVIAGEKGGPPPPVATTLADFFQPGTQPLGAGVPGSFNPMITSTQCQTCHNNFGPSDPFVMVDPYRPWVSSMMGQAARDPLFHAGLTIANQDAANSGEFCIRCHAPAAYLSGHAVPTDGSAFTPEDYQSITCNFCHRLVDPVYVEGTSPEEDESILNDLAAASLLPPQPSNARYVVDPTDVRRGPFDDIALNMHIGTPQPPIIPSPFHQMAELCWNCHDVSNPMLTKQGGQYVLNTLDEAHPTQQQLEMMPLHRTYSEWKNSYYSTVGVQHLGRFGGNHFYNPEFIKDGTAGIMKDCQDCHMPDQVGYGCSFTFDPFIERQDAPQHSFVGSNNWVLQAVRTVDADGNGEPDYPDGDTGLSDELVDGAIARNVDLLEKASDFFLSQVGGQLKVRLLNRGGHKLPTGFPDGRRIWVNVQFLECDDSLIAERGAYDFNTGTLNEADTKVYEIRLGIQGTEYAQSIGRSEGPTFHFMLANTILKDNRIPPAGYANSVAQQNQTAPVGATYTNGQNWNDTFYDIPATANRAIVTVHYQLVSKEFIEHLRDDNVTDNRGQVVYDLWVASGMSPPVVMDSGFLVLSQPADVNQDGTIGIDDLFAVIATWGSCPDAGPGSCPADLDDNGVVDIDDLFTVIASWDPC